MHTEFRRFFNRRSPIRMQQPDMPDEFRAIPIVRHANDAEAWRAAGFTVRTRADVDRILAVADRILADRGFKRRPA